MLTGQNDHRDSRMERRLWQGRLTCSRLAQAWDSGVRQVGEASGRWAEAPPGPSSTEGAGTGLRLVSPNAKCKRVLELDISFIFLVDLKHVLTRNVTGLCAAGKPANR